MEKPHRTRRSIIKSLTLALLGAGGLWRFFTPRWLPERETVVSIPLADVPANGALVLPEQQCAVVRASGEIRAVSLACTHLGCTVTATADGFVCPCHGSQFGCGGQVQQGPATRALNRLPLERKDDMIRISRS